MNKQITSVFYSSDLLPYKDSARTIHYPLTGGTFVGSHNTKQIRFYVRDIGGTDNITWVVLSKLPNGKLGYEICSNVAYDEEVGEYYLQFDLSAYYTSAKGDLYLSLRGYEGEVEFEDDNNDGVYNIVGEPLIEVTGTIKLSINYSPMVNTGTQVLPTDIDRIILALNNYIPKDMGIVVIPNINYNVGSYNNGQIFFAEEQKAFYKKVSGALVKEEIALPFTSNANQSVEELYNLYGAKPFTLQWFSSLLICHITYNYINWLYQFDVYEYNLQDEGEILYYQFGTNTGTDTFYDLFYERTPNNTFATKEYVDSQLQEFLQNEYTKVNIITYPTLDSFLASTGEEGYIYLYPIDTSDESKGYYQYIWENNDWVSLGSTNIDLSGYYNKEEVDDLLDEKQDTLVSGTNIKTLNGESLLGSGNIDYDTELDDTSTNAVQNKVLNSEITDIKYRLAVLEEAILGEDTLNYTYLSNALIPNMSDNNYPIIASAGLDLINVKGRSFLYNQTAQNGNFASTSGWNGVGGTLSVSNNVATISPNISQSYTRLYRNNTPQSIVGHKYLFNLEVMLDNSTAISNSSIQFAGVNISNVISGASVNTWFSFKHLVTASSKTGTIQFSVSNSGIESSYSLKIRNVQIFDLTKMGIDSATTVDEAIALLQQNGINPYEYNEYNIGKIIDSKPTAIVSKGYNILSLERTLGTLTGSSATTPRSFEEDKYYVGLTIANGYVPNNISQYNVSKESVSITSTSSGYGIGFPIKVIPNKSYTLEYIPTSTYMYVIWYDKEGNYISYNDNAGSGVVAPNNAYWGVVLLRPSANTPTTYINICFHITGTRTGYAPYKATITYQLSLPVLRSVETYQDNTKKQNIANLVLNGTENNWVKGNSYNYVEGFYLEGSYNDLTDNEHIRGICMISRGVWSQASTFSNIDELSLCFNYPSPASRLYLLIPKTENITTVAQLKTWLSNNNIDVNYVLTSPTDQPTITLPENIEIELGGSLEVVYDDGYTTPCDFTFNCAVYKPIQ